MEAPELPEPVRYLINGSAKLKEKCAVSYACFASGHGAGNATEWLPIYTADQLRSRDAWWAARLEDAVRQEKQRCVRLCEGIAEVCAASSNGARKIAGINAANSCAAAIRG